MTADQDVYAQGNGIAQDGAGNPLPQNPLPFAEVAFFFAANMFGLGKDYAFPEGSNISSSRWDQITSLAKLLSRKTPKLADGNQYDIFDMLYTNTKWILSQNVHINDDAVNSVNYKGRNAGALSPESPRALRSPGPVAADEHEHPGQ